MSDKLTLGKLGFPLLLIVALIAGVASYLFWQQQAEPKQFLRQLKRVYSLHRPRHRSR
ncbi:hypothetical protein ALON55S_00946 [Alishewanella longhuensis]